jgi:clan AA aspartic protease
MGRVTERIKVTNFVDPAKSVEVEALIDTGATMLALPQDIVDELGLTKFKDLTVRYADNRRVAKPVYGVVSVEMAGRGGHFDVLAEPKGAQPLVGQIVLEQLDLIVDPGARRVVPDPRSPDMPMVEQMAATARPARGA